MRGEERSKRRNEKLGYEWSVKRGEERRKRRSEKLG